MIELERVVGLAFVQDGGRPGLLREGVPRGGALIPSALAAANRAVGNPEHAAGIERYGAITIVARGDVTVADDDARVWTLHDGERIELAWDGARRARFVALQGGIDVPRVLGGRGTLVAARIGGLEGRPLRRGDVLRTASEPITTAHALAWTPHQGAIRLVAGPDLDVYAPSAIDALTSRAWRLSTRSDRTGTRLEAPAIPWRDDAPAARTTPMIAGAIELPPGGEPIVLGVDHPTTGGYPVVALVAGVDLDRFHAIPLGRDVRFTTITIDEARALLRQSGGTT
ncbi:biotin-dependent carboxyltransferase family protein [Sandaracinus amylolyticus]|uniref:5-oxoprolinase subunit C family protein n=1 Tax=Sandaracinus amylolyticus TaxID=927083 RepID=UPI001F1924D6|nr:biotin-dependent carboxyltransferase family protein [Sandaracinus amylolyticus]UJR79214.1 Biotin-dependent carboxyltransferase [Sandaracinus amylolyticus]